jgi:hypothetical protein
MGNFSKGFSLLLVVILAVSNLIIIESTFAQTPTPSPVPIPTPSVPEFTLKFVDSSYDVPTTTSIDQYTGKTITNQGYHVENRTIQLAIKNQPFNSFIANGQNISFFFNVREKGHYAENWTEIYSAGRGYLYESNSAYTTVSYSLSQNEFPFWNYVTSDATIDFQVQALIGYTNERHYSDDGQFIPFPSSYFKGQTSDWSNTQTITIPEPSTSTSPSPNPTPTPTVPEFPSWTISLLLTIIVASAGLLVYYKRKAKAAYSKKLE